VVTVSITGTPVVVVEGDAVTLRELPIVPVMTSIGTAALLVPLHLTVTVAEPPPTGVTNPEEESTVRMEPVVSEVVHVSEVQVELLPLTSVGLADICKVGEAVFVVLRTAVVGLTVMLATEFGETKKPLQPIINPATATNPISARIALPVRDIAPPEHTFSS
jgi:hypothetical protein